jgi:hypothetical protein
MGIRAIYSLISAHEFNKHKRDLANADLARSLSITIDKAWLEFHQVFREMAKPLRLVIRGDYSAYGRLEGGLIEVGDEDGDDFYLAHLSPSMVKKINAALSEFTEDDLFISIRQLGWPCGRPEKNYYRTHFKNLKEAHKTATERGAALEILIT